MNEWPDDGLSVFGSDTSSAAVPLKQQYTVVGYSFKMFPETLYF